MQDSSRFAGYAAGFALLMAAVMGVQAPAIAQTANSAMLEVPVRSVPVPTTVSPQMAKDHRRCRYGPTGTCSPKPARNGNRSRRPARSPTIKNIPGMIERLQVKIERTDRDRRHKSLHRHA